jgi:hypothetical protein
MATIFQSYRLFLNTLDVDLTPEMHMEIEVYGACFVVLDFDLVVHVQSVEDVYVFSTVGVELESETDSFADIIIEKYGLRQGISFRIFAYPLIE